MNFRDLFLESLISAPKLSAGEQPDKFLGQIMPSENESSSPIFHLLSCGQICARSPWTFDIRSMDCFLYLYTEEGCGKLLINSQVYSLEVGSFLLLDCNQRFRIDVAIEPWNYRIAFASGSPIAYYRCLFPKERLHILRTSTYSDFYMHMDRLLKLYPGNRLPQKLIISDLLGHMTVNSITSLLNEAAPIRQIPSYIEEMRTLFDQKFQQAYTLNDLEKYFHVSKYRLCREFSAAYSISPLQYLNKHRVDMAMHLLCTTNHRIHEVGNMVGIENTNHFITLFRKYTGTTPSEYRQRMAF